MKKFKYYGREVEVPDYATHIAVDADGEGWWFMGRPVKKGDIYCEQNGGNCGRVGYFDNVDNWKGSLRSC
ncbi:hypothetical protein [Flyfo podovirus Tbat2_2]|nr:hypothetical protein [Flyfo podovirus Tbat2_2]